jgi:hypothetical protein
MVTSPSLVRAVAVSVWPSWAVPLMVRVGASGATVTCAVALVVLMLVPSCAVAVTASAKFASLEGVIASPLSAPAASCAAVNVMLPLANVSAPWLLLSAALAGMPLMVSDQRGADRQRDRLPLGAARVLQRQGRGVGVGRNGNVNSLARRSR